MEWRAFFALSPWGVGKTEYLLATVCVILAETNRDRKLRPNPYKVEDFIPAWAGPAKQTGDQLKGKVMQLAKAFGAVERKRDDRE